MSASTFQLKQKIKAKKGNASSSSPKSPSQPSQKARIRFVVGGPSNLFGCVYTETEYDGKDDFMKPMLEAIKQGKMKSAMFFLGGKPCSRRESHEVNDYKSSGRPNFKEPGTFWPWGCQPFVHVEAGTDIEVGTCAGIVPDIVKASKKYIADTKKKGGTFYPKSVSVIVLIPVCGCYIFPFNSNNSFLRRVQKQ
jgi:hypothetical protein